MAQLSLGGKIGLSMANFSGESSDSFQMKNTYHFGGVIEAKFTEKFALQLELMYANKGAKFTEVIAGESQTAEFALGYTSWNILGKYYLTRNLCLEAGTEIGFALISDIKREDEDRVSVKENTRIDGGFQLGAGYYFDFGLFVQARYNPGMSKVFKEQHHGNASDIIVLNNHEQFYLRLYVHGYTVQEIINFLELPKSKIYSIRARLKQKFKTKVK